MSGFDGAWLTLREPADSRARSSAFDTRLRGFLGSRSEMIEIVDLGAGTGANLRYLAPRLGGRQRWTLVEKDPALLGAISRASQNWARGAGLAVTGSSSVLGMSGGGLRLDATLREADLAEALDDLPLPRAALVTASALLDLVSRAWLERLAARCAAARAPALFALTYDGRSSLEPAESFDAEIVELVNRHQQRDKGFGPALGPRAAPVAQERFAAEGYGVEQAPSDWRIDSNDQELLAGLLRGWAEAATETAPERAAAIASWLERRLATNAAGRLAATVGHTDVLALPKCSGARSANEPLSAVSRTRGG